MLVALRRLRALAAWLAVCVVVAPSAAALCAHAEAAEPAAPCHESGGDPAMEGMTHQAPPAPEHGPSETACVSACCAGLGVRAEAPAVAPASALAPVVHAVEVEAPPRAPAVTAAAARDHPPPGPALIEIGRLLI